MGQDAFGGGNGASRLGLNARRFSRDQAKISGSFLKNPVFMKTFF